MFRLMFRPALLLTGIFALAVVVMQPGPYDDSLLRTFMAAPENCAGGCLLGIYPGQTTVNQALAFLEHHDWVTSVQVNASGNGYGQIRWEWSEQRPAVIDETYPGRLTFYWDKDENYGLDVISVDTVSVTISAPIFTLQSLYGRPDSGTANLRPDGDVNYSATFHEWGSTLALSTVMRCPVNLHTFWDAGAKMTISIGYGTTPYRPPVYTSSIC